MVLLFPWAAWAGVIAYLISTKAVFGGVPRAALYVGGWLVAPWAPPARVGTQEPYGHYDSLILLIHIATSPLRKN